MACVQGRTDRFLPVCLQVVDVEVDEKLLWGCSSCIMKNTRKVKVVQIEMESLLILL